MTPYTAQVRKVKSAKNRFLVLFYSAKSISDHFTISEIFQVFFKKSIFFTVSNPILQRWEIWGQKKIILVLFNSAKSISDQFTIWEFFQVFWKKSNFSLFRTLYCKGEKHEVRKKSFLVLFYSAISISDQFTIWELFQVFFSKHQFFFTVSNPILQRWEAWGQKKIIFSALL